MTAYSVSGTLVPDATTANTGEPAGTYNGQNYWSWMNGVTTWYLAFGTPDKWYISTEKGDIPRNGGAWTRLSSAGITGEYETLGTATGTATVAEISDEESSSSSSTSSESSSSQSNSSQSSSLSSTSSASLTSSLSSASSTSSQSSSSSSSSSSMTSSESSSQSSSSASSSTSAGVIDLPRSCAIAATGMSSFTAVVEKPT